MPIIKHFGERSVSIPNDTAQDAEISIEALGALTRMASYSDSFQFKAEWLQNNWQMGRDKVRAILRELKDKGYLKIVASRSDDGKGFDGHEWHISTRRTFTQSDVFSDTLETRDSGNQSLNKKEENTKKDEKRRILVENSKLVFAFWQETFPHHAGKSYLPREKFIVARLKTFTVAQLKLAIRGVLRDSHYMGDNDRGKRFDDIDNIFRNDLRIEKFLDLANNVKAQTADQPERRKSFRELHEEKKAQEALTAKS